MPEIRSPHPARCHCGAVRLRVRLLDGLRSARRCNCSLCRMRGAVAVSAPLDGVEVVAGAEHLRLYQFGTHVAEHWFCGLCGIYTHHRRRSNPSELGVNVAVLEGVSPFDFAAVEVMEGGRHPSDGGGGVAGVLRYEATPPATPRP
ncbi:GFA family protein [Jannaschia sp. W003]|uniref:GFA family protein n=1 Tax=Jannaschia sp. W003 TaxID=2867012 RepID=UPI0021A8AE7F|nr:GFA family protein [Jannaschia sp. W003]UWQ21146.1 GFA family protein [Jannaschia sp. W003]